MIVKTEAMVEVATTFIATESENRATKMIMMIAMSTHFSGHSPNRVRSPSGRDNKFKAESNCALEHSRKIADVKASQIGTSTVHGNTICEPSRVTKLRATLRFRFERIHTIPLVASIELLLQGRRATTTESTLSSPLRAILLFAKVMIKRTC